jgi:hypothetical protein
MNLFGKILRLFQRDTQERMESNNDNHKESNEQNPVSSEEIKKLVLPIIRKATKIEVQNAVSPPL